MNFIKNLFKKTVTKVISALIVVLLILSVFIFWGWYEKQINKVRGMYYVYKGDKAFKKHQLQQAINNYNIGLKLYPEHAKARCNLGNIYVMFEDFYSATDSYVKALEYKPNFIVCRMNHGIVEAEKLANYDTAIREYDTIIKTKPRIIQIPFIYSNWKSTKQNKAIASYNKGLAYRGKSLYIGEKSFIAKQYLEKAEAAYKYALKTLKQSFNTHYNLALTNHLLGDYREAGLEYCKAISIEPMNFEAHYNLAILLKHLGHYKESLVEFEKAGMLMDARGDNDKAQLIYNSLNEVNQRLVLLGEYDYLKNKTESYHQTKEEVVFRHGKVVVDHHDKHKLHRFMKNCPTKHIFKDYATNEK